MHRAGDVPLVLRHRRRRIVRVQRRAPPRRQERRVRHLYRRDARTLVMREGDEVVGAAFAIPVGMGRADVGERRAVVLVAEHLSERQT